jgi:Ni/Co efflux regulator RcnB
MPFIQIKFPRSQAKWATSALRSQLLVLLSALLLSGVALAERSEGHGGGRHDNVGDREHRGNGGKHSQGSDRQGPEMHSTDRRGSDRKGQDRRDDDRQGPSRVEMRAGAYFQDRQRSAVHDYYGTQYRTGRCPPGLSRKHNGCMPPGQVRYYSVGQRLAPAVIYHTVPSAMVVTLGVPPSGHRYVRVASDILLIAIGTGMVVDAIQDLGGM